ncbi:MAG TPA: methyltransferase [Gemmataceae bacterium]|nr:methyltransferase [Gemmataceae bacterium]
MDKMNSSEMQARNWLLQLIRGYISTQSIYVAAKLKIADYLASGPRTSHELAQRVGAHAPTLRRFLRGLANLGVVEEYEAGAFNLTAVGQALRSDVPGSLQGAAVLTGELLYPVRAGLITAVQEGRTPVEDYLGKPLFDYLSEQPELRELFHAGLAETKPNVAAAIARDFEIEDNCTVVDVGGGQGTLLAAILAAHPRVQGILFDRAEVLQKASAGLTGVLDRVQLCSGDFFQSVPRGGDLYLLSWILHDWDDERATTLLKNCRNAMEAGRPGTRLLIIEALAPDRVTRPSLAVELDLAMLVLTGGQERTAQEYQALLQAAGLRLLRVYAIGDGRSVIEAGLP